MAQKYTPKQSAVILTNDWLFEGQEDPRNMDVDDMSEALDMKITEARRTKIVDQVDKLLNPVRKRIEKNLAAMEEAE